MNIMKNDEIIEIHMRITKIIEIHMRIIQKQKKKTRRENH